MICLHPCFIQFSPSSDSFPPQYFCAISENRIILFGSFQDFEKQATGHFRLSVQIYIYYIACAKSDRQKKVWTPYKFVAQLSQSRSIRFICVILALHFNKVVKTSVMTMTAHNPRNKSKVQADEMMILCHSKNLMGSIESISIKLTEVNQCAT